MMRRACFCSTPDAFSDVAVGSAAAIVIDPANAADLG
jgi:hypothetical protein